MPLRFQRDVYRYRLAGQGCSKFPFFGRSAINGLGHAVLEYVPGKLLGVAYRRPESCSVYIGAKVAVGVMEQTVGLCASCRHMRRIESDRGSIFYLCELSKIDPLFPKYPRLPVLSCTGYEKRPVS